MTFEEKIEALVAARIEQAVEQKLADMIGTDTPTAPNTVAEQQALSLEEEERKSQPHATNGTAYMATVIAKCTGLADAGKYQRISDALAVLGTPMSADAIRIMLNREIEEPGSIRRGLVSSAKLHVSQANKVFDFTAKR